MSAPTCPECGNAWEGPEHCDDCEIARSLRREAFIRQASAQQKSDALHRYAKKLGAACTWQPGENGARTYCVDANGESFDVASEDEVLELLQDIDKAGGAYDTSRVDFHRLRATVESMKASLCAVEELMARQGPKWENVKDPWGLGLEVDPNSPGETIFQAAGPDCDVDVLRDKAGLRFEMWNDRERDHCVAVLDREKLVELVGAIRRWLACST